MGSAGRRNVDALGRGPGLPRSSAQTSRQPNGLTEREIPAAGGVVWRRDGNRVEVALAHRPRYDDWSFPKGKLDPGESTLAAAVREVHEETGAEVAVDRALGEIDYLTARGRKTVHYWSMGLRSGTFRPSAEVDEIAWVPVAAARRLLSYQVDQEVLNRFGRTPVPDATVLLVRHARAGKRTKWHGSDNKRPLDAVGLHQARRLVPLASYFGPTAIYAADRVRCEQTVAPLSAATALPVHKDAIFSDDAYDADPRATLAALAGLAVDGQVSVVASQGVTIPGVIETLFPKVMNAATRKGALWLVTFANGQPLSADYYEDACRPAPKTPVGHQP